MDTHSSARVLLEDERRGFFGVLCDHAMQAERRRLVNWLIALKKKLSLSASTFMRCVNILDACMSRMPFIEKSGMKLLGTACMHIASEYEEVHVLEEIAFVRAADRAFTEQILINTGLQVFKTLGCSISVPTEIEFLSLLVPQGSNKECIKLTQLLLMVMSVKGTSYLPSVRATGCARLAHRAMGTKEPPNVFDIPYDVIHEYESSVIEYVGKIEERTLDTYKTLSQWTPVFIRVCTLPVTEVGDIEAERFKVHTYYQPDLRLEHIPPLRSAGDDILGMGAFAEVMRLEYKGTTYAVKRPHVKRHILNCNNIREISIMQTLAHDNIVKILHITSDLVSVFMELGEGDLYTYVVNQGPLNHVRQLEFAQQMLDALVYIHGRGVVHRDIKPGNIIVFKDGDKVNYKLADFGAARGGITTSDPCRYTTEICTLRYRSPELLMGSRRYNDRLDVWSMMCTFYEAATGYILFPGEVNNKRMLATIFRCLGTPDEYMWPDVVDLPLYRLLDTKYEAIPDFFSRPLLCPAYRKLLVTGLVMNPSNRPSSRALQVMLADITTADAIHISTTDARK